MLYRQNKFIQRNSSTALKTAMVKRKIAKAKIKPKAEEDEVDDELGWTDGIENHLHRLQNKGLVFKMLHARSAVLLARRKKIMNIVNVVSTATAGTTLFANLPYSYTVVDIITALVLYITSLLIVITQFVMDNSQADEHKTAENDFDELVNTIERQLVLEPCFRQHAREFLVWIDHDFRSKFEKSPMISPRMIKNMEKEFGSKLNPELIDAKHINEPEREPAEEAEPIAAQDSFLQEGEIDLSAENEIDSLQAEFDQDEADEERRVKLGERKRTRKKKIIKMSTDIFENEQANAKVAQIWDDMQMNWELSRYQQ